MKKHILAFTCAVALLITGNGTCLTVEAAEKPVSLSKKNITLKAGQTKKLKVKKIAKVKIKSKTFTSSNKKAVIVTKKTGKIKAKKAGKAMITVKVKYINKPGKKKTVILKCKVIVSRSGATATEPAVSSKPTEPTPLPTEEPKPGKDKKTEKKAEEVMILKQLIAEQKALGATVSEDLNASWQYTWDKEGHLVSIDWEGCGLRGIINFGGFPYLTKLNCG